MRVLYQSEFRYKESERWQNELIQKSDTGIDELKGIMQEWRDKIEIKLMVK